MPVRPDRRTGPSSTDALMSFTPVPKYDEGTQVNVWVGCPTLELIHSAELIDLSRHPSFQDTRVFKTPEDLAEG
jgi:hypothetical protein